MKNNPEITWTGEVVGTYNSFFVDLRSDGDYVSHAQDTATGMNGDPDATDQPKDDNDSTVIGPTWDQMAAGEVIVARMIDLRGVTSDDRS